MDAARQVLGEQANSPVVSQLLTDNPGSGVVEFSILRDFFVNVPATKNDYNLLKGMLSMKMQQAQEQQNGQS